MPWRPRYYILDAHGQPQAVETVEEWAAWFEANTDARIVSRDRNEGPDHREVWVSTVFLALDHNFLGEGPPILWETMVFGGPLADECERYSSLQDALIGHQRMCRRVTASLAR